MKLIDDIFIIAMLFMFHINFWCGALGTKDKSTDMYARASVAGVLALFLINHRDNLK